MKVGRLAPSIDENYEQFQTFVVLYEIFKERK